jgi:hypothetical protein
VQVALWAPLALWLIARAAQETRSQRLFALGAWTFAALATMAKGPAGLVVPAAAVVVCAVARRSTRPLLSLEIPVGLAVATAMIGPWYLALYARHGRAFLDELVMRNMLGRTLDHLHDTNDLEDVGLVYFVRQLGYATFPWCGIAVSAVLAAARRDDERSSRGGVRALLFGAAVVSFALVSSMRTKFHHYVLIALPPIAMLAGIWLDEIVAMAEVQGRKLRGAWAATSAIAATCIVTLVGRDLATTASGGRGPAHFILLLTYRYVRSWPSAAISRPTIAAIAVLATIATAALASRIARKNALVATTVCGVVLSVVLRGSYLPRSSADGGQRGVLAAYYKDRSFADHAPLVAYQLNWKGENFYTGNHVAIFVSSGAPMKSYLDRRREHGEDTVYFVTERGRVRALQGELGAVRSFTELTGPEVSAEFSLVRATL